jgi:hypothetical protein
MLLSIYVHVDHICVVSSETVLNCHHWMSLLLHCRSNAL